MRRLVFISALRSLRLVPLRDMRGSSVLPAEIWLRALSFLPAPTMHVVSSAVSRRLAGLLATDAHVYWKAACAREWADKSPRFRLTPERERKLEQFFDGCWLSAYKFYYVDGRRSLIQDSELRALEWWLAFHVSTHDGVARGALPTLQPVSFREGESLGQECTDLHVENYPPMQVTCHFFTIEHHV